MYLHLQSHKVSPFATHKYPVYNCFLITSPLGQIRRANAVMCDMYPLFIIKIHIPNFISEGRRDTFLLGCILLSLAFAYAIKIPALRLPKQLEFS